jgi:O-antigen/teichoic acid export membrane protein
MMRQAILCGAAMRQVPRLEVPVTKDLSMTETDGKSRGRPAGLKQRILRGGMVNLAGTMATHILRLASNLVMTRLLAPEAFGLMAMVLTTHMALEMLTDIGINNSVVRADRGDAPRYLRTAWTAQMLRSCCIAAVVAAVGGLLALLGPDIAPMGTVYADPRLPGMIAVSALAMVVRGLESTAVPLAVRKLRFVGITLLDIGTQLATMAIMIAFAMVEPSVWALVVGLIAGRVVRTAISHLAFEGPRMGFEWDREIAADLWRFGRWVIGSSMLTYVAMNADRLILGGLIDAHDFGLYVIAMLWVQAGVTVLQIITHRVSMSAYSEIRRTAPERLPQAFRKTVMVFDGICLATCLAGILGGAQLITLLYEPRYASSGAYLGMLSFSFLTLRYRQYGALLLSKGDSLGMMYANAIEAAALCLLLPLGFHLGGIWGVLPVVALSRLTAAPLLIMRSAREIKPSIAREVAIAAAILISAGAYYMLVMLPAQAAAS